MHTWTDETKKRTYVRIESPAQLFDIGESWMCWPAICKAYKCSRTTAMRCLQSIEAANPKYSVLYLLVRVPGQPARTRRAGNKGEIDHWFTHRRSVGNPNFTDSGFQSSLFPSWSFPTFTASLRHPIPKTPPRSARSPPKNSPRIWLDGIPWHGAIFEVNPLYSRLIFPFFRVSPSHRPPLYKP